MGKLQNKNEQLQKKRPDNSKDAVDVYIAYLDKGYHKWYESAVGRNRIFWTILQTLSILSGFGTSVLAALLKKNIVTDDASGWAVVILPFIGSLASTVLIQSRVHDLWALRDEGRMAFQKLATEARRRYAAATNAEQYNQLYEDLEKEADEIEHQQSIRFFAHTKGKKS